MLYYYNKRYFNIFAPPFFLKNCLINLVIIVWENYNYTCELLILLIFLLQAHKMAMDPPALVNDDTFNSFRSKCQQVFDQCPDLEVQMRNSFRVIDSALTAWLVVGI